jgi:TonB-dependent starch-binding outer membrane protein SusC
MQKTWRVMRITTILITVFCLQVSAKIQSQTVTFSGENIPLEKLFNIIKKQTGYFIVYNKEQVQSAPPVSIKAKKKPLKAFIDEILKNQEFEYTIEENTISIKRKHTTTRMRNAPPISGVVRDANGNPLANISVTIKGTNKGTSTDADGKFSIEAKENDIIIISSIGYTTKEINTLNDNLIVTLDISSSPLDQVQIIAYGKTTKRFNTGNVTTVKNEEIEKQPVSNSLGALAGRIPSLDITQNTGMAGGGFSVQIRGKSSIANGNDPLYIIDGVPFISSSITSFLTTWNLAGGSPLSAFNPADIASIEVLKDADATAIYGSRGANGVILITTKKGEAGASRINVNAYAGIGKVPKKLSLLNTRQYLDMRSEAFTNDGAAPDPNVDYDLTLWDTSRYTDWQEMLIGGTSNIADVQASLSGGNTNTQFLIGGGYHRETTVFPGDFADRRISTHFNINHTSANKRFKALLSGSYAVENNHLPQEDVTNKAIILPPVAPEIYDAQGQYNWANSTFTNPYAYYLLHTSKLANNHVLGNLTLTYELLPGLTIKNVLGYTKLDATEITTAPTNSWLPAWGVKNGIAYFGNSATKTWSVEPQIEYQRQISRGTLGLLIGTGLQESKTDGQVLLGQGYVSNALLETISAAASISMLSSNYAQYRYQATFARINYDWQHKYIINVTARRDGSSRFGPGKQFGNFGALGAAWLFSEEPAVKRNLAFLTFGKLRASYGVTGNDQIADYQFLSTFSPTTYPYQGRPGLLPTRLFNADFAWETNRKLEGGLELGFLKDRLFLSVSYYRNRSSNQLVGDPLPAITGFTAIQSNFPALVENRGWEFQITSTNVSTINFEWSSSFNMTLPRNRLLRFDNLESSNYSTLYAVGKSLFVQKSFPFLGVNPQSGIYEFTDSKGNITSSPAYPTDLQPISTLEKKFYGGLSNSVKYRGFELSFFLQFVKQTGWSYMYGGNQLATPGMLGNQPTEVLKRWQQAGDVTAIPRFTQSYASDAFTAYSWASYFGENRLTDASYIRLKNAYLSYQLPQKAITKLHIEGCSVYVMGQNLATITKYIGLDPETQSLVFLPPLRVITAGIKLTL